MGFFTAIGNWLYVSTILTILITTGIVGQYVYNYIKLRYFTKFDYYRGKTVVLTGATSGIGLQMATQLYLAGAQLLLIGRNADSLNKLIFNELLPLTENALLTLPPNPIPLVMDLALPELLQQQKLDTNNNNSSMNQSMLMNQTQQQQQTTSATTIIPPYTTDGEIIGMQRLVDIIQRTAPHGKVDMVVCCAGVSMRDEVIKMTGIVEQKIMNTNFVFNASLCRLMLQKQLFAQDGRILLVSSIQGLMTIPFRSSYAASKYAAQAYFTALRHELAIAQRDISVTIISPGYVNTNLSHNALVGTGAQYNKLDATTANGLDPEFVAFMSLSAALHRITEMWLCPPHHKLLILIQLWSTKLTDTILQKRGKKQYIEMLKSQ